MGAYRAGIKSIHGGSSLSIVACDAGWRGFALVPRRGGYHLRNMERLTYVAQKCTPLRVDAIDRECIILLNDKHFLAVGHFGMQLASLLCPVEAIPCSGQTSRKVRAQSLEASLNKLQRAGRAAMEKDINHVHKGPLFGGPLFFDTVSSFAQSTPIRKVGSQSNGAKA